MPRFLIKPRLSKVTDLEITCRCARAPTKEEVEEGWKEERVSGRNSRRRTRETPPQLAKKHLEGNMSDKEVELNLKGMNRTQTATVKTKREIMKMDEEGKQESMSSSSSSQL